MSLRLGAGCCAALVASGPGGRPQQCAAPVTRCGLLLRAPSRGRPVEAWLGFTCAGHDDRLVAARELLDRDRAILDAWRFEPGRPWRRPEPLARGAAAVRLVARARDWAERHAVDEPPG